MNYDISVLQIAATNLKPGDQVRQLLQNQGVCRQALDLLTMLDPIATAVYDMQGILFFTLL